MSDKKQIGAVFLFEFKMGRNATGITCNINNTFGPGTANEWRVQWFKWFKKFCKGDMSFEDEEHSGQPLEGNNTIKADPVTNIREVAKECNTVHALVIWHLKPIGKVKNLDKWVSHEPTTNQINRHFEVHLLLFYATTTNHFLIGL